MGFLSFFLFFPPHNPAICLLNKSHAPRAKHDKLWRGNFCETLFVKIYGLGREKSRFQSLWSRFASIVSKTYRNVGVRFPRVSFLPFSSPLSLPPFVLFSIHLLARWNNQWNATSSIPCDPRTSLKAENQCRSQAPTVFWRAHVGYPLSGCTGVQRNRVITTYTSHGGWGRGWIDLDIVSRGEEGNGFTVRIRGVHSLRLLM